MRRDLELAREILHEIEKRRWVDLSQFGVAEAKVLKQMDRLFAAGYFESRIIGAPVDYADRLAKLGREARGQGDKELVLTAKGQELARAAGNLFVWQGAEARLRAKGAKVDIDDLAEALRASLTDLRVNGIRPKPSQARSGCSQKQLTLLENRQGLCLPASLKKFLLAQDGGPWPSTSLVIFPIRAPKKRTWFHIGDLTNVEWNRVTTDERRASIDRAKLILIGSDESSGGLVVLNYKEKSVPTIWWLWRDIGDVLRKAASSFDEFVQQRAAAAEEESVCGCLMRITAALRSIRTKDDVRLHHSALEDAVKAYVPIERLLLPQPQGRSGTGSAALKYCRKQLLKQMQRIRRNVELANSLDILQAIPGWTQELQRRQKRGAGKRRTGRKKGM